MPLLSTREIVDAAVAGGHGVAAFNAITLEHAEAITRGAETAGQAVIVQVSQNAVVFHDGDVHPLAAAVLAIAARCDVPVSLHLDHVDDVALLHQAADAGFSSVMFDASTLDYADNVAVTREAAAWAHERGLYVEAELGVVGGKGGAHAPGVRTDPDEAERFVAETAVDALAVAVGSSHAMTQRTSELDLELIARLAGAVAVPLVLHGSSGVPDRGLRDAVARGIVKINIGTILNVEFTAAVRQALDADPAMVDPRKYLGSARQAMTDVVARLSAAVGAIAS